MGAWRWFWSQSWRLRTTLVLLLVWAWPALRADSYGRGEWGLACYLLGIYFLGIGGLTWLQRREQRDVDSLRNDS